MDTVWGILECPSAFRGPPGYIASLGERKERRMREIQLACRLCDGTYSEHQVRLKAVNPEENWVQCLNRGSSQGGS